MKRIMTIFAVAAFISVAGFGFTVASAADTQNFTFTGQGSGDSGTCGPDWANDTYTRVFKVYPEQNVDGSYRVVEYFTNGHFVTIQGPSPESCEALTSNTVSANVNGNFHGNEVIKVVGGTFSSSAAAAWSGVGGTDGFVVAAFGVAPDTKIVSDFWFKYHTGNVAACSKTWVNAATGNAGDIATFCP